MMEGKIIWTAKDADGHIEFYEQAFCASQESTWAIAKRLTQETGFILGQILNVDGRVAYNFTSDSVVEVTK